MTGTTMPLGDWGTLTVGGQTVDRTSPAGTRGYHGTVVELDIRLTSDHGGPAGVERDPDRHRRRRAFRLRLPPRRPTTTTSTTDTTSASDGPSVGDLPSERPSQTGKNTPSPLKIQPKLTAGRYVFPVYGPTSYIDTFGASRADVTYHHGDDIFGQLGQPLVACADGTLFSVGWNKIGGNRLWLLDEQGNQFYYAHLSAFAATSTNGARVKAGQVIGFMGKTGDAEGTPVHLHFEVHPGLAALSRLRRCGRPDAVPRRLEPPAGSRVPDRCRLGSARPRRAGHARARRDPARDARHLDRGRPRSRLARARACAAQALRADADARSDCGRADRPTSAAVRDRATSRASSRRRSRPAVGSRRRTRRRCPRRAPSTSGASPGRSTG